MNPQFNTATFLAAGGLILVAAVVGLLFFHPVPEGNVSALNIVVGALISWVGMAFAFYYGSTKSSQTKDDTIATLTKNQPGEQP